MNQLVNCDNMSYAKKSMIRCGLALDRDGTWSISQLFPHLQDIVARHRKYFEGLEVLNYLAHIKVYIFYVYISFCIVMFFNYKVAVLFFPILNLLFYPIILLQMNIFLYVFIIVFTFTSLI